jgi:hypothetical protein
MLSESAGKSTSRWLVSHLHLTKIGPLRSIAFGQQTLRNGSDQRNFPPDRKTGARGQGGANPYSRDAQRPRFANRLRPKSEGARDPPRRGRSRSSREDAGKTGCALHPRSRVQYVHQNAHTSIQVQRKHSGLPRAMALRLIRALPGDRLSCHRRRQITLST